MICLDDKFVGLDDKFVALDDQFFGLYDKFVWFGYVCLVGMISLLVWMISLVWFG